MLSNRLVRASHRARLLQPRIIASRALFSHHSSLRAEADIGADPGMNGGYINPPKQKREDRDPYGEWWDKQERRNFGEPVHEDNDILGRFSPYPYRHFSSERGLVLWAGFISCVLGLSGAVYLTYPDRPSYPKEYASGLDAELGGPNALRARKAGDPAP